MLPPRPGILVHPWLILLKIKTPKQKKEVTPEFERMVRRLLERRLKPHTTIKGDGRSDDDHPAWKARSCWHSRGLVAFGGGSCLTGRPQIGTVGNGSKQSSALSRLDVEAVNPEDIHPGALAALDELATIPGGDGKIAADVLAEFPERLL